ncbi:MAG: squalene synthase HpnC [Betaproteobacteria bacterium]|nr:squalene synthase HpnC [Betaproteobacteria bacterium]
MPVDHYENFPVASLLLPRRLRRPIEVIYRFARSADDIADEGDAAGEERLRGLRGYVEELDRLSRGLAAQTPLFRELGVVVQTWALPLEPFYDLLSAFAQDVSVRRYADYETLGDYCRRSANPVGRLVLALNGRSDAASLEYSDAICTALQLINFWQDIGIDWKKGRVYLPQSEMARFGIGEEGIARAAGPDAPGMPPEWEAQWKALIAAQLDYAQALLLRGAPLARQLPGRLGWEIRLTVQGGQRIIEKIRAVSGDVFHHRPVLGARDWILMALRAARMR